MLLLIQLLNQSRRRDFAGRVLESDLGVTIGSSCAALFLGRRPSGAPHGSGWSTSNVFESFSVLP